MILLCTFCVTSIRQGNTARLMFERSTGKPVGPRANERSDVRTGAGPGGFNLRSE